MAKFQKNLKYTKEHEWVKLENNIATIGISDYAQSKLGDIVFVELPQINKNVNQFEELCVVESVKAASDIYSPISGTVSEINNELERSPQIVNESPYENGWIAKFKNIKKEDLNNLMSAEEYKTFLNSL